MPKAYQTPRCGRLLACYAAGMEPPSIQPAPSKEFKKMTALLQRIVKVPKDELDRRATEDKKQRQRQKRAARH